MFACFNIEAKEKVEREKGWDSVERSEPSLTKRERGVGLVQVSDGAFSVV